MGTQLRLETRPGKGSSAKLGLITMRPTSPCIFVAAVALLGLACRAEYDAAAVIHIDLRVTDEYGRMLENVAVSFADLGPCNHPREPVWRLAARTNENGRAIARFRHEWHHEGHDY